MLQPDDLHRPAERELHLRGTVDLTRRPRRSHAGQVHVQGPAPVSRDDDHVHSGEHDRSRPPRRSPSRAPARVRRSPAASRSLGSPPPAFKTCPSPVTYVQLSDGTWKFEVQSTSTHGRDRPDAGHLSVHDRHDAADRRRAGRADHPGRRTAAARWNARRSGELVRDRYVQSFLRSALHGRAARRRDPGEPWVVRGDTDAGRTCRGRRRRSCRLRRVARITSCACEAENQLGVAAEGPAGDPFALDVIDDSDASIVYSTGLGADHRQRRVRREAPHHQQRRRHCDDDVLGPVDRRRSRRSVPPTDRSGSASTRPSALPAAPPPRCIPLPRSSATSSTSAVLSPPGRTPFRSPTRPVRRSRSTGSSCSADDPGLGSSGHGRPKGVTSATSGRG